MSKKVCRFVFVFLVLLPFTSINAFAGDIPEGIMLGEQKALFIGKITDINSDTITITPTTVMMGSVKQSEFQIKKFDNYYGTSTKPQTGDFIVAVLIDDEKIDDTWIFKSTTDDYKTLKLVSEQYDIVTRYEKYINDGEYFEAQKRLDEKAKESSVSTNANVQNPQSYDDNYMVQSHTARYIFIAISVILVGCVFISLLKKRNSF